MFLVIKREDAVEGEESATVQGKDAKDRREIGKDRREKVSRREIDKAVSCTILIQMARE